MEKYSFLNGIHPSEIEDMYSKYLKYPDSIEPQWRAFFQGFDFANENYRGDNEDEIDQNSNGQDNLQIVKEAKVTKLIYEYKHRGHLFTKTNPVRKRRVYTPDLNIARFGLTEENMEESFQSGEMIGIGKATLRNIIDTLQKMYCQSIGVEYMHIRKPEEMEWIQSWINRNANMPNFSNEKKKKILKYLSNAVNFESFLHTKYVGKKRFSLEGNEALIPAIREIARMSAKFDMKEIVLGMAHRGRLNVLANIFGKEYKSIFSEFEHKEYTDEDFEGDVKYHLGWTTYKKVGDKQVRLNIAPNPSHLETVDSIVEGIARCKIDVNNQTCDGYEKVLPVLIHGDAAISGQGIVYEVLQMSQLDGYKTGGTIHIVVNNQIGFTTNYIDSRSTTYCTDIGKITMSPILHINADDVEAVIHGVQFAMEYRKKFKKDVFLDLLGYRKYGHNEGDEPRFTQPILYKTIAKHPNVKEIYTEKLLKENVLSKQEIDKMETDFKNLLEREFDRAKDDKNTEILPIMKDEWKDFKATNDTNKTLEILETKISDKKLDSLAKSLTTIPQGNKLVKKIERLLQERYKMVKENKIDWGMAENLAYASLLDEGYNVRISGQDVERGTFSHRHAVLKVEDSEEEIIFLKNISLKQGKFNIYNSLLSEYGVMGFEYGYAMTDPNSLTIWEAQFGDFSNGAQIITDQYLSASEEKWKMQNGLVVLLPHGYEGQGAEHSSGRMERYLQLCAGNNMYVADCTTPANLFHLLRLQMKRNFRKPLVIFTPKSLLRHPRCVSSAQDFTKGRFEPIIDDEIVKKEEVKTVVLCTGKFYYDLYQERETSNRKDVALIRLERLYPLNDKEIYEVIKSYKNANDIVWAQEEPENMGAWMHILRHLNKINFRVCSLPASGVPSAGNFLRAMKKHEDNINKVFNN